MMERKCFIYRRFGHVAHNVENRQREGLTQKSLNKFQVLKSRVMNVGSRGEIKKDRKMILREKRLKEEKTSKSKKDKMRKVVKKSND